MLKNLESKVKEIFANTNTLKQNQIKGKKQLADLAETVNFLSERFHDDLKKMQSQVDQQAQYFRRNSLLFYGIKEEKGENTDSIIINTIKEEVDLEILPIFKIGRIVLETLKQKKEERPIMVKFVNPLSTMINFCDK